ncbi:hypothetical protein SAMN05421788_102251 [Filimonas lacunae]|uniref:Transglycosylase SLT domain-containing protein n=1 Tax=Filimonas lacunae TaxID=477680 RepID=A0A173MHM6_9BACT|nr:hypothetical protein [Filimonas lacunae]BAV07124.1 hypothetical protein FLA_3144 [Filimonas lacunae]SIS94709.1 hypothetical protein SAMN05421788_102251 [Filimonas lacunae]
MALPITESQARRATVWLKTHFEQDITAALANTPWTIDLVCAIACQETAYKWLYWINTHQPDIILQRCVLDASGDFPGTSRKAFPKNRTAFEAKYGPALTNMLIEEGNKQRAMPQPDAPNRYKPAKYLYKGYGLFQNDLQNITDNPSFFENRQWYNMGDCVKQLVVELERKAAHASDLRTTVRMYNGSGQRAENYADNVMQFHEIAKMV